MFIILHRYGLRLRASPVLGLSVQILICQNLSNAIFFATTWFSVQISHIFYQNIRPIFLPTFWQSGPCFSHAPDTCTPHGGLGWIDFLYVDPSLLPRVFVFIFSSLAVEI